jgi:hypothetical protein
MLLLLPLPNKPAYVEEKDISTGWIIQSWSGVHNVLVGMDLQLGVPGKLTAGSSHREAVVSLRRHERCQWHIKAWCWHS